MGKFFEGSGSSLISGAIGMIGGAISDRRNYNTGYYNTGYYNTGYYN